MKKLTTIAFLLALAVSCLLLVSPAYQQFGSIMGTSGETTMSTANHAVQVGLLKANGPRVLIPLAVPPVIALMAVLLPKRSVRIGAAIALTFFSFVAGFSVGLFYVPSAVLMILAGLRRPSSPAM